MKKGFTLIELLVVVLIIGILAAIALPQYLRAVYKTRFKEAEVQLSALFYAQQRCKLATGDYCQSIDDLDIDIFNDCVDGENWANWYHTKICKNFRIGLGGSTVTAVPLFLKDGNPHFSKYYNEGGKTTCRLMGSNNIHFKTYCESMDYTIVP